MILQKERLRVLQISMAFVTCSKGNVKLVMEALEGKRYVAKKCAAPCKKSEIHLYPVIKLVGRTVLWYWLENI